LVIVETFEAIALSGLCILLRLYPSHDPGVLRRCL